MRSQTRHRSFRLTSVPSRASLRPQLRVTQCAWIVAALALGHSLAVGDVSSFHQEVSYSLLVDCLGFDRAAEQSPTSWSYLYGEIADAGVSLLAIVGGVSGLVSFVAAAITFAFAPVESNKQGVALSE